MLVAACLACLLGPAPARALTPAEAQSLPVGDLARRVLGEVGRTVIAVDRPVLTRECGGPICPPVDPTIVARSDPPPPPLTNGMTFYQRPVPALGGLQPVWLCDTTAIDVFYRDAGDVGEIRLRHRYGLSSPPHRRTSPHGERDLAEESVACAKTTRIEDFFHAGDDSSAYKVSLASLLLAELASKPQPLPFPLVCHVMAGKSPNCSKAEDARAVAARLDIRQFFAVEQSPCAAVEDAGRRREETTCYRITMKAWNEQFMVEMNDSIEDPRIVRIVYDKGMSVY